MSGFLFFDDIPLTGGTRQATISHKGFLFSNFAAKILHKFQSNFHKILVKFPQNLTQICCKAFCTNFSQICTETHLIVLFRFHHFHLKCPFLRNVLISRRSGFQSFGQKQYLPLRKPFSLMDPSEIY